MRSLCYKKIFIKLVDKDFLCDIIYTNKCSGSDKVDEKIFEKLTVLADAAKYDVSCVSKGGVEFGLFI